MTGLLVILAVVGAYLAGIVTGVWLSKIDGDEYITDVDHE